MSQALTATDPVLAQSNGGYFKSKLRLWFGRVELTPRQLVYYRRSQWFAMFGLIGALFGAKSNGKRFLELELAQMRELARGKHGLNTKILDVTMADGAQHRFMVDKFDDFTTALRAEVGKHARLIDAGAERWQIAAS